MTCKDCIHYKACDDSYNFVDEKDIDKICLEFEDKSHFIELPCKVGDTVFCFSPCFKEDSDIKLEVVEAKVVEVRAIASVLGLNFSIDNIGKTVFLTREEAEKALGHSRKEDENV